MSCSSYQELHHFQIQKDARKSKIKFALSSLDKGWFSPPDRGLLAK